MRRMSGIWPPSNPGRVWPPERAVCPLPPRPAVLPIPEPGPRPLRMRARCEPAGARRPCSTRRSTVTGLALAFAFRRIGAFALGRARPVVFGFRFVGAMPLLAFLHRRHLNEVAHLIEHPAERGVILLHHGVLMMLESERFERPPLERRAADTGVGLLDPQRGRAHRRQRAAGAPLALAILPPAGPARHAAPSSTAANGRVPRRCTSPWP